MVRRSANVLALVAALAALLPAALVAPPAFAAPGAPLAPPTTAATAPAAPTVTVHYVPPVDAPIVDHFRPPACTWCPGNRGIDYDTAPGTAVHAAAPGTVTFAGRIGGDGFVTVAHADGLRTSYAFLATIAVRSGQVVARGEILGTTAGRLHFGVRRGSTYLDPELLFAGGRVRARLVPTDGSPARSPRPPARTAETGSHPVG
jgi:murein DD-endopeptidase MepM/ murein hydrolase activator NlpD